MPIGLHRCPPEFAGAERAAYVTKPLVRWTRHRELLALSRSREPFSPAWRAVREGVLNGFLIAAPPAIGLTIVLSWLDQPKESIIPLLVFSGTPWLFVALGTIGVLFPREMLWALRRRQSGCVLPYAGAVPLWTGARLRERMAGLHLAGIGFRGFATLLAAQRAFLTRGAVLRLRWLWPAFFASVCALDNLMKMLVASSRDQFGLKVAVAFLGFLCWFGLFHIVLLPLRRGGALWSVRWASYLICTGWGARLRWSLAAVRDMGGWALLLLGLILTYAALFAAARRLGHYPVAWYIQPLATFAWLIVFAALRGRIERALSGGANRSLRRLLAEGEPRFADFVRRLSEKP